MNLKIGGSNVGKIMYNGQEFGGATKLEPGTILYMSKQKEKDFESVHLLSTTRNWNNINGINLRVYRANVKYGEENINADIYGYDFKNLDIEKRYQTNNLTPRTVTVSRSIVDGEYRLNALFDSNTWIFLITAI